MMLGFTGASFWLQEAKPKVKNKINRINLNFKNIVI